MMRTDSSKQPHDVQEPGNLEKHQLLDARQITTAVEQMAAAIIEHCPGHLPLAIVGIQTRGVPLARRLLAIIREQRADTFFGTLDISLYRDDLDNLGTIPAIKGSDIPFDANGCQVVLVDDVLFTGRTIHASIDALMDYGRPRRIELAALVDRGNREIPIAATYRGLEVATSREDYVTVRLRESDPEETEEAVLLRPAT